DCFTPISAVYGYQPGSPNKKDGPEKSVPSIEARVLTKYMPTASQEVYMVFPRALALSEVAWSPATTTVGTDSAGRLHGPCRLLQGLNVNYYRPSFKPSIKVSYDDTLRRSLISISSEQYQPIIRYTTDGSIPNARSPQYVEPLELFKSAKVKAA